MSFGTADSDLNRANNRIQECLEAVAEWSKRKKMNINVSKSEITFFSNDPKEAKWRPDIQLDGQSVPYNPNPKFLGVHLDRTLSFSEHVKYVPRRLNRETECWPA